LDGAADAVALGGDADRHGEDEGPRGRASEDDEDARVDVLADTPPSADPAALRHSQRGGGPQESDPSDGVELLARHAEAPYRGVSTQLLPS